MQVDQSRAVMGEPPALGTPLPGPSLTSTPHSVCPPQCQPLDIPTPRNRAFQKQAGCYGESGKPSPVSCGFRLLGLHLVPPEPGELRGSSPT